MPILGNGSSSGAGGGGGGFTSSGSSSFASSRNSSSTALDDKKFPTLQKKKQIKKVIIPRVNEVKVADPNSWGKKQSQPSITSNVNNDLDGIEIIDKRKQKMKRKQEKLLFSNAI